ncbi:MAG: hypothetical protein ACRCY3_12860 [Sphingorhabdus sp.]
MKSREFRLLAAVCLSASIAQIPLAAQTINPPPPSEGATVGPTINPLVGYIEKAYNIPRSKAEERVRIQGEITSLLENPAFIQDPDFDGVVVQNEPVYQVFLLFSDNSAKNDLLKLVPPTLRQYVKIRKTKLNRGQRQKAESDIAAALKGAGIEAVVVYDKRDDRFTIQAPGATQEQVRSAIPAAFANEFNLDTSPFPKPQQATTGSTSGRPANAGYSLVEGCTLAFPVTYTFGGTANRQGILSVGHCFTPTDPDRSLSWGDGTKTVFQNPVWTLSRDSVDVAFLDTTGMTTGYWLFYDNPAISRGGFPNQVGGYETPQGWLKTKNFIRQSASWVGMNVCKQGYSTALTCGEVTHLNYPYTYFGNGTFVRVSNSKQSRLSAPGDSGGPWFTSTVVGSTTEVSALGLHITGDGTGATGYSLYMPIDRVFSLSGGPSNVRLFTTP